MTVPPTQLDRFTTALSERYRIQQEIGRGGMAVVYLAEDVKHYRRVALKVLRPELTAALGAERFLAEIRFTAQLNNPHIVPLYDSGEAEGMLFYVMPYVEGESLRARLRRERQLPVEDAIDIALDVASALGYAHDRGLVHRDIKPENILLSGKEAVVADFGVARAVAAGGGNRLTETGLTVGTPAYMSPEQAAGERELDGRSDGYALGCVLYEMLTGEAPLLGATAQATVARRFAETPSPIRAVRDAVPPEVDQMVQRMLARVPADRFQTVGQFADALRNAAGINRLSPPAPIPASTPSRRWPMSRLSRRGRLAVAALGVMALFVAGWLLLRPATSAELNPNLLAVAPFDVLDPTLDVWREGLVDVLSASLDGAGPLRVAAPSTVVRRWEGRADAASATRLAEGLGTGLVLFGRLISAGEDSVRLSASLFDVAPRRTLAELEFRGRASRVDQLADSLATRVLTELARDRVMGTMRLHSLGSSSPAALKAFLHAERHLRRFHLDSAEQYFGEAIELDSGFALAYNHRGIARSWEPRKFDASRLDAFKAASLNHHMAPRESLLIVADSLYGAVPDFTGDSISWSNMSRLFSTLDRATREYPTDLGAWYRLGEARIHWGAFDPVSERESVRPFARALELDSGYAPAYEHAIQGALWFEGAEAGRRAMSAYLALNPSASVTVKAHPLIFAALDPSAGPEVLRQLADTASDWAIRGAMFNLGPLQDSSEKGLTLLRRYAARADTGWAPRFLAKLLARRGHFRDAIAWMDTAVVGGPDSVPALYADLAMLGAVPEAEARQKFQTWLRPEGFRQLHSVVAPANRNDLAAVVPANRTYLALGWWYEAGDTASLRRASRLADELLTGPRLSSADTAFTRYTRDVAAAYLALARGDTAQALDRLANPWPCGPCYRERMLKAHLLAGHQHREAMRILDTAPITGEFPWLPGATIWLLERAKINERSGDRVVAEEAYQAVVDAWRQGDPEVQPMVAEARSGLARVTGERAAGVTPAN